MVELIQDLHDIESHDDTTHYGLFIWPSAMVLAYFVARHRTRIATNKVVMEIGCGTGLPGILAAICGKPKAVYLTDRSDAIDIQRNVEVNIRINGIQDVASFLPLDWGQVTGNEHLLDLFRTISRT
uniref:Methyltransferase small domain-containing protein n=1 Tax=Globisporangium ultimum (strain ATCC 200006 / CBS 805.95 / DAOM BR144) TaxID=431595 RepID=K3WAS1_GLOUD